MSPRYASVQRAARYWISAILCVSLTACQSSDEKSTTGDMAGFLGKENNRAIVGRILSHTPSQERKVVSIMQSKALAQYTQQGPASAPAFKARYEGLPTSNDLRQQIAFQLFRNEAIRKKKSWAHSVSITRGANPPGVNSRSSTPPLNFSLRSGGRRYRRHVFRTPYFKELRNQAATALADIGTVLSRLGQTQPKERIELLRLALVLSKTSGEITTGRTILLTTAMPSEINTQSSAPERGETKVRFTAMNYYNLLEKNLGLKKYNNDLFIKEMGPSALRALKVGNALHAAREEIKNIRKTPQRTYKPFVPAYRNLSSSGRATLVPMVGK